MSPLTGAQKASLIDALLSGYTSDEQLAELLDLHLDVKLEEITEDGPLRTRVFGVVTWAESHGRTKDLALQAQKYRPRNEALAAFTDAHYPGERTQPPHGSSAESVSGNSGPRSSWSSALVYGAVAAVAVLIAVIVITLRPWRGPETGGNSGSGGNSGGITKDAITKNRPRLPATLRFTELSGSASEERVYVNARFPPPQLAPGSVLWFVVGSGQRCRERVYQAQVNNPALGYMRSIIRAERARVTCAQLFVADANGKAIAFSDPRDIAFQTR